MEYASGGELFSKLKPDVGLSEAEAQNYFRQLLAAVKYLHTANLCHRDIKPENILFTEDGKLKLIDFGNCSMLRSRSGMCLKISSLTFKASGKLLQKSIEFYYRYSL